MSTTRSNVQSKRRRASRSREQTTPTPVSADDVFSSFKDYLEDKLAENNKGMEEKTKIDKQVAQMKFKGNQCQYELNAKLENILDKIQDENADTSESIQKLVAEGKEMLKKRQKLIRIADKSKDGWKVVEEYVSDELASDTEDEKRLRKAKETVARKRKFTKQSEDLKDSKKPRNSSRESERQLFRGKISPYNFVFAICTPITLLFSLCIWVRGEPAI